MTDQGLLRFKNLLTYQEDTAMKTQKERLFQQDYELDNYLNEDEDTRYYDAAGNTTVWYG